MEKKYAQKLDSSLKLLVKTSFVVFIGVLISKILGYVFRVLVARHYGPEVYGLFSLAVMIAGWFIAISALGLSEGILRFIPLYRGKEEGEKIRYIFKFVLSIFAITSILSGILLYFLSGFISTNIFHNPGLVGFLKIFSFVIPATVLAYPFLSSLRAFEEIKSYSFIFNIIQNVAKVSLLVLFVILGINSDSVSLSYLLGTLVMLAGSYYICKNKIPHLFYKDGFKKIDRTSLKRELFGYSIPIMFFGIVSIVFYWIDSFSIGFYKSAIEVGFYNAAVPIALLLGVVPELFMQLFFPLITREYSKKNMKLIEDLSKQVAKWVLLVNLPIFAIIIAFPGAVINLFFGAEYLVAENALRILAIGALISSLFIISNNLVSMIGKSKLVLMNVVIASLVNLILNAILVPMPQIGFIENSLGLNGAAIATLISIIVFNILFVSEAYYHLSIVPLKRKMVNAIVSAAIPTLLLFYARTMLPSNDLLTLVLLCASFLAVYGILIIATGALDENDAMIIRSAWKKFF